MSLVPLLTTSSGGRTMAARTLPSTPLTATFDGAHSVYATDMDGDGDMDVLGAACFADDITWWENDGSESFTRHTIDGDFDGASPCTPPTWTATGIWMSWAQPVRPMTSPGGRTMAARALPSTPLTAISTAHTRYTPPMWTATGIWMFWAQPGMPTTSPGGRTTAARTLPSTPLMAISTAPSPCTPPTWMATGMWMSWARPSPADDITWWENDGSENFTEHTIDDNFSGATPCTPPTWTATGMWMSWVQPTMPMTSPGGRTMAARALPSTPLLTISMAQARCMPPTWTATGTWMCSVRLRGCRRGRLVGTGPATHGGVSPLTIKECRPTGIGTRAR